MTRLRVRRTMSRLRRIAVLAATVSVAVSVAGVAVPFPAAPASALTLLPNCGARVAAPAFAPWGDFNPYFPVANGGFESGASGWSVSDGAAVTPGNETYFVGALTDSHSLVIPNGGRAKSPTTCVALGENSVRLFVKSSGTGPSSLHVQASVENALTGIVLSTGFDVDASAATQDWSPTSTFDVPNLLGGLVGVQNLTLVFTARGSSAVSWSIDDVYVDPFKLR
jgi:hypothetical protein